MSDLTTVTVLPNGPLMCKGALMVGGVGFAETYLCRCGASSNKPFCDGSHKGAFTDPGAVKGVDVDVAGGEVKVSALPDGPLFFKGGFAVTSGDGTTTVRAAKGALCRCGASANKPFCDGAHKSCGFKG